MNHPLVSIIIPTYNRAHLIGETLDSVLAQNHTHWECIVVDDGSTDETEQLLNEYCKKDSRFKYHHRPANKPKGANSCRNYGFEMSIGEYVNWFDDDDVMLEDFLKIKVNAFTTEVDLVICSGYFWDSLLDNRVKMHLENVFDLFKDFVLWKQHIITNSVLFRKSFFKDKKLFSYKITRGQEAELFSRLFFQLSKNSYSIVNYPLFLYRQHADTKTAKNNEYVKSYKESQSYIFMENLKRSFQIKDKELVNFCYKYLIHSFFRSIEKKHLKNSNFILNGLFGLINKKNIIVSFKLLLIGNILLLGRRGSYKIEKYFKRILIKT